MHRAQVIFPLAIAINKIVFSITKNQINSTISHEVVIMRSICILLLILASNALGQDLNNPNGLAPCSNGTLHNCWGTYSADGAKYVGEWRNGNRHGQGTQTYSDGTQSSGEWRDGLLNGMGMTNHADGDKYVGEFKDSKKHGRGIYTKAQGKRLEGIFENDKFVHAAKVNLPSFNSSVRQESKPIDNGIFPSLPKCPGSPATKVTIEKQKQSWNNCMGVIDSDEDTFTVVYKNGRMEGVGMLVSKKSGYQLIAKWDKDLIRLDDVEIIYGTTQKGAISYKGSVNSEFLGNGNGMMIFRDGAKYVGQFSNGAAHGLGKRFGSDGQVLYEGRFVNGYPENNRNSPGGSPSIFMDELLKGGGLNCHQVRNQCRQTNNYYACIDSFNRGRPFGEQTCNP